MDPFSNHLQSWRVQSGAGVIRAELWLQTHPAGGERILAAPIWLCLHWAMFASAHKRSWVQFLFLQSDTIERMSEMTLLISTHTHTHTNKIKQQTLKMNKGPFYSDSI